MPIPIPIDNTCRPARSYSSLRGVVARAVMILGFSLGLVVAGCSAAEVSTLQKAGVEPGSDFGATIPDVGPDESMTFGFIALCVGTGAGVTLTAASFEDSTNLEIVGFAVNDAPRGDSSFGAEKVTLVDAGFDATQREVSAPCPDEGDFLGLELRREAEPITGRGDRLVLTYAGTEDGSEGRSVIPFFVVLCAPTDMTDECS